MIVRLLVFVVVAALGYVATVAGAFVYWDMTGASGPDYTPLLFVLFVLAPVVALTLAAVVLRRLRKPPPSEPPEAGRELWRHSGGPVVTTRRNGPMQWAIAIAVMVLLGAFASLLGPGAGTFTYIPRIAP